MKILQYFLLLICLVSCTFDISTETQILRDISIEDAQTLIANKNDQLVILDVRTPKEYDDGHLKGAINENFYLGVFPDNIKKMDKDKTYLVYCQEGPRAKKAIKLMKEQGFKEAYNLYGGYEKWQQAGLEVIIK